MDSLHPFGGSGTKNDPHLRRFLRDLDTYIPREEQLAVGRSRRHKPDTDEAFLRILEESRLEFEADKRMQQGTIKYNKTVHQLSFVTIRSGIGQ